MTPLKVTAELSGPVAGDVPKLDALIEWCMSRHVAQSLGLAHDRGEGRSPYEPGVIPSPIARRQVDGFDWPIPLCSWPIYDAQHDAHHHFVRRLDARPEMLSRHRVYYENMGEFRAHRLPLRVRTIPEVVWFCVGARKEIRRMLRDVRRLGKKPSQGYGEIAAWRVEDADDDLAWFAPSEHGTVLMRAMPAAMQLPDDLIGYRPWFGGLVPPYWAGEFHAEMVEPC